MKTLETAVAGMNHRVTLHTQEKLAELVPFDVKLRREPNNPADRNAVKVIVLEGDFKGFHIGYVPRGVAAKLSPLMKSKRVVVMRARVTSLEPSVGEADLKIRYTKGKQAKKENP